MYLPRWMLYQLMRSRWTRYLKLAFFPIMACVLLAGHASGQTLGNHARDEVIIDFFNTPHSQTSDKTASA